MKNYEAPKAVVIDFENDYVVALDFSPVAPGSGLVLS